MVGAWCFGCCQAHQGLPVGFLLLRYSVLFTVESLSLLYLLFISWFIYFRRWCIDKLGVFHANQTSGIQFYLLLSFYLCFISFLYLDLYVLGDDALMSEGSFMQTKHLWVLILIRTKGEVGAPLNRFKLSSIIFYWPIQGGATLVDHLSYLSCFVMLSYTSVCWCLVVTC